jgi:hypothetical protein
MRNKTYHTVGTISKSKIERGKIDSSCTQIHDHSMSCLGTGISLKTSFMDPNPQ